VHSLDSGNVTQNFRKLDRLEAGAACKHSRVPIRDGEGYVVKSEKMTRMQTFFALLKSYCAINVLLTPKSFANGGFLLSPIALTAACILQTICAVKLSQCGIHVKKISYPDIVKKALGKKCKAALEIALALVQFQFTIAQLSFIIQGLKSTAETLF
jgi:amino acid permease